MNRGAREEKCKLCECREFLSNPWKEEKCLNCYHYHKPGSLIAEQISLEPPDTSSFIGAQFHGSISKGTLKKLLANPQNAEDLDSSSSESTISNNNNHKYAQDSQANGDVKANPFKVSKSSIGRRGWDSPANGPPESSAERKETVRRPRPPNAPRPMNQPKIWEIKPQNSSSNLSLSNSAYKTSQTTNTLNTGKAMSPPEVRPAAMTTASSLGKPKIPPPLPDKKNRPPVPQSVSTINNKIEAIPDQKVNPSLKVNKMRELLETERSYNQSLGILTHCFFIPLKSNPSQHGLKKNHPAEIFSNLEQLATFNAQLLNNFEERLSGEIDPNQTLIADIFINLGPYLKPYYSTYCENYASANSVLNECQKIKDFTNFLENVQNSELCKGETIRSFLIKPIQRIPRYQLLLEEIYQHTPSTHLDKGSLREAIEKIKGIASDVNEAIRRGENTVKILAIQNAFISGARPSLVAPHRIYVKDGCLQKICRKETKPRWFFLFNDILIYGKALETGTSLIATRYVMSQSFKLFGLRIEDVPNTFYVVNAFQIITPTKSFTVSAPSKDSKIEWMLSIQECMDAEKKRRETFAKKGVKVSDEVIFSAPVWHPNTDRCQICDVKFSTFLRRHHCRICGQCVCDKCSPTKVALVNYGKDPVRICSNCWKDLQG